MQRLFIIAALAIIAVAVALSSFPKVGAQQGGAGDNKAIDLTGKWKTDDGNAVVIVQSGQTVKAMFVVGAPGENCEWGGRRDFYFVGSLSDSALTGTMKRCTRIKQLVVDCHLSDPYDAKIVDVTVSQNTISGKYVPDWITYDEKNGHYVNCGIKPGGGDKAGFELTRECGDKDARRQHSRPSSDNCKPDRVKGCQDIEQTKIVFSQAALPATKGDLSDKAMEQLKEALDPWLDTLRADFCDNSGTRESIDKLSDDLSDLLCEGEWLERDRFLHVFQKRLNLLRHDVCGSVAP